MKLCRFQDAAGSVRVGLATDDRTVADLTSAGVKKLSELWESRHRAALLRELAERRLPEHPLASVRLLAPVDRQEIWAAGVTYLRSKTARMEESDFSATAYDRVYLAERPELFFKALPEKVAGPDEVVGIREDARWNVPEPELALVINSHGEWVGCTIGNDMSSRDIEGENLLYLPQAKVYERSCALGPFVTVGVAEEDARRWSIQLAIERQAKVAFSGNTSVSQIKRSFQDLIAYLFRSQKFPEGAILLTGTGIVPPDQFSLEEGDVVRIGISGIGELTNRVRRV